jgi:hypothetical protein
MGEANRRQRDGAHTDLGSDWLKAAQLVWQVIDEAHRQGARVILRPTTAPSPHGSDGPIELARSADGRSLMITLFGVPGSLRREFIAKSAETGAVQILLEGQA